MPPSAQLLRYLVALALTLHSPTSSHTTDEPAPVTISRLHGASSYSPSPSSLVAYWVTGAGLHTANGLYTCPEFYDVYHLNDVLDRGANLSRVTCTHSDVGSPWRLGVNYVFGRHGKRMVWGLTNHNLGGLVYLCIPQASTTPTPTNAPEAPPAPSAAHSKQYLSPGKPEGGRWKVSGSFKPPPHMGEGSTTEPPPTITLRMVETRPVAAASALLQETPLETFEGLVAKLASSMWYEASQHASRVKTHVCVNSTAASGSANIATRASPMDLCLGGWRLPFTTGVALLDGVWDVDGAVQCFEIAYGAMLNSEACVPVVAGARVLGKTLSGDAAAAVAITRQRGTAPCTDDPASLLQGLETALRSFNDRKHSASILGRLSHVLEASKRLIASSTTSREIGDAHSDDHDLTSFHLHLSSLLLQYGATELARRHVGQAANHPSWGSTFDGVEALRTSLSACVPPVLNHWEAQDLEAPGRCLRRELNVVRRDPRWHAAVQDPVSQLGVRWHFLLAYLGVSQLRTMRLIEHALRNVSPGLSFVAAPPPVAPRSKRNATPQQPDVRVGFVSAHFRFHSVGRLLCNVVLETRHTAAATNKRGRDGAATSFEPILFHTAAQAGNEDAISHKLRAVAKQHTLPSDLTQAQRVLSEAELDILVFADIGMDSLSSYLAFGRYAPFQVAFWGHPVTTGLSTIDFFITSPLFEPKHGIEGIVPSSFGPHATFSEQLLLLEGLNTAFDRPNPKRAARSLRSVIIGAERSIEDTTQFKIYLCAQNPTKLHPMFDAVLAQLLARDAQALVVLMRNQAQPLTHLKLHERLRRALSGSPGDLASRLVFVDQGTHETFRDLVCSADVFLDPFPFGGGVTALEAMHCGVPVVTLPSLQTVHRLAAGMVHVANSTRNAVATDVESYVASAMELAHHSGVPGGANAPVFTSTEPISEWREFLHTAAAALSRS